MFHIVIIYERNPISMSWYLLDFCIYVDPTLADKFAAQYVRRDDEHHQIMRITAPMVEGTDPTFNIADFFSKSSKPI